MMKIVINSEFSYIVTLHLIRIFLEITNSGKSIYEESNM
jgi:hypothetical protein